MYIDNMIPIIIAFGIAGLGYYTKKYYEDLETLNKRYSEILRWTKKYAATEKLSEEEIVIDLKSIDKMLEFAIEKNLKNFEITEETYRMLYENYVEYKLKQAL